MGSVCVIVTNIPVRTLSRDVKFMSSLRLSVVVKYENEKNKKNKRPVKGNTITGANNNTVIHATHVRNMHILRWITNLFAH